MNIDTCDCVKAHILIAPDDLDFVGVVLAYAVLAGEEVQIAAASLYVGEPPRITYTVPDKVAYEDVPKLTRLLAEFADRVRVEKTRHP